MYDITGMILAIPGVLMALVFHEWAHARMALAFGDPTARNQGRLTLDPRAHLDWFGVIVLLMSGFRFGWARPVPVSVHRLRPRFWGELLVALAGILMNLALACLFVILAALAHGGTLGLRNEMLNRALDLAWGINLWLATFNFLPIPPLDGWRVAARLIPGFYGTRAARFLDNFGMFILMLLLIFPFGQGVLNLLLSPIFGGMQFIVRILTAPVLRLL